MRKRPSRRRLKRRFLRYRAVSLHDIWRHDLVDFVKWRYKYHVTANLMIQRDRPVVRMDLEEYSIENLRAFFTGELADDTQD
jgi:hypothetical protein